MERQNTIFKNNTIDSSFLLPDEYKGKTIKNGGLTINNPRKWTSKEIEWSLMLKSKGFTTKQIAECIGRDYTQVSIKMKRIGKNEKTYNQNHIDEKYSCNDYFISKIKPVSVLDLYSGCHSYYEDKVESLVTNDFNQKFHTYYSVKAEKLVCKLWYENYKFDLIDLDPFGSAYDCFDLSIKMAKKGLIITFGELGHKRYKRIDFVQRYYGIENLNDFNIKNLINHVIMIGKRNKKILIPIIVKEWKNIGRVYFQILNNKNELDVPNK